MIKMIMKNILSITTTIVLVCILSVTYSCKGNTEDLCLTNNYIHEGNPDVLSFISDLKEAGCYTHNSVIVERFYHTCYYHAYLSCPTKMEIPEKFTKVLKNSKDPIQIAKVKDAIEQAKKIHEEKVEKFNKAYQLLMYGFKQFKSKANDSICLSDKDTIAIAITFDTTLKECDVVPPFDSTLVSKIQEWTIGKNETLLVYAVKGNESNRILFVYKSALPEDTNKIVFYDPDTTLIEHTMLKHLNSRKVRSVDVSYEYTSKVDPANNDSIRSVFQKYGYENSSKSVGKHFFIPLTEKERSTFVNELVSDMDTIFHSQHNTKIYWNASDIKLKDDITDETFIFVLSSDYYEGKMPPIPKDANMSSLYYDYELKEEEKLRHYYLRGILTPDGLHILRLKTTQSAYIPHDWIHIRKCVDFDYEYCDLTKEGS